MKLLILIVNIQTFIRFKVVQMGTAIAGDITPNNFYESQDHIE